MSVIVEAGVKAGSFELGRILDVPDVPDYTLESVVPIGESAVPFVTVENGDLAAFEAEVQAHPAVERIALETEPDGVAIFALDWDAGRDEFLTQVAAHDGHVLEAANRDRRWIFTLYFPDRATARDFEERCQDAGTDVEVLSIRNPWEPELDAAEALTPAQREALFVAEERGYYAIPRRISTSELADEFEISDQAMTERLRRGIVSLVRRARE